jgi:CubicO group peptidase (beta-lactamase class C family)
MPSPSEQRLATLPGKEGAGTGYHLAGDGSLETAPAQICTVPAAGGLWTTAADLVRFGLSWASLLPAGLAREALRPQVDRDSTGARMGLGWLLNEPKDIGGHAGGGPGAAGAADHPAEYRIAERRPGQPPRPDRAGQRPPGPPDRLNYGPPGFRRAG